MSLDLLLFQPACINQRIVSFSSISNGLIALANYINNNGYKAKICHFNIDGSLEEIVNDKIKRYKPKNIGISLDWHMHCYPSFLLF